MNHCQCGEVKALVDVEGVFYCDKCLSMDEEVQYEKTGSIDQQFQVFKEEILEKKEPIEMKQVPTASTKDQLSEDSTAQGNFMSLFFPCCRLFSVLYYLLS